MNTNALPAMTKSLYNGNIARQTTDVGPFGALTAFYTYDQLNRLRYASYFTRNGDVALLPGTGYGSSYKYDQDGNLKALTRKDGAGAVMDNFSYSYNRLSDVPASASHADATTLYGNITKDNQPVLRTAQVGRNPIVVTKPGGCRYPDSSVRQE